MSDIYTPEKLVKFYTPEIHSKLDIGIPENQIHQWSELVVTEVCKGREPAFQTAFRNLLLKEIIKYTTRQRVTHTYSGKVTSNIVIDSGDIDPGDWIPVFFPKKCWERAKETLITHECRIATVRATGGHKAYAEPIRFAEPK
jgi:hypothetical protein